MSPYYRRPFVFACILSAVSPHQSTLLQPLPSSVFTDYPFWFVPVQNYIRKSKAHIMLRGGSEHAVLVLDLSLDHAGMHIIVG
jgi:hypothetical protein